MALNEDPGVPLLTDGAEGAWTAVETHVAPMNSTASSQLRELLPTPAGQRPLATNLAV